MQFVEEFAGGEAVVELAEESVEQVSLSLDGSSLRRRGEHRNAVWLRGTLAGR